MSRDSRDSRDELYARKSRFSITSLNGRRESREKTRTLPVFGSAESKPSFSSIRKPSINNASLFANEQIFVEDDDDSEKNSEKVKVKLMSLWNNVKYGWSAKLKTSFNYETPIWFLGVCYHKNCESQRRLTDDKFSRTAIDMFKYDYFSRIWLTYRRDFPKITGSQLTTDCGWGCMLRSGQMILSQAFLCHYLGRDWRWCGPQSDKADMIHRMIIKWFVDDPNSSCSPFSVHQLVKFGSNFGKKPGDWFGPSSVAHIMREALNEASIDNPVMDSICIYIAQDCTIYIQDVFDLCSKSNRAQQRERKRSEAVKQEQIGKRRASYARANSLKDDLELGIDTLNMSQCSIEQDSSDFASDLTSPLPLFNSKASSTFNLLENNYSFSNEAHSLPNDMYSDSESTTTSGQKWRGVVIFVPLRLGGEKFNPFYTSCVKALFTHPTCIGIIGGRPKNSLYFVGMQDDKLIYLDPHYCQEAIDIRQTNFPLQSFHCSSPRKMLITRMDPSCTIGFYCHTRQDFLSLISSAREIAVPANYKKEYPLFVFAEGSSKNDFHDITTDERVLRVKHCYLNRKGSVEKVVEAEDFMMI